MTPAITTSTWLATLRKIKRSTKDDNAYVAISMLQEIIKRSDDPAVGEVLDEFAVRMLKQAS